MQDLPSSYLSPRFEVRPVAGKGYGAFALEPIRKDELIAAWGGLVAHETVFMTLPPDIMSLSVQIEEELFLVSDRPGPGDRINHCCEPNAGINGAVLLVALRDIAPGEEICYDYAMTDGQPYDNFTCACGVPTCRGQITGDDWRKPELWAKYDGYFSAYLQRRIERLKQLQTEGEHNA